MPIGVGRASPRAFTSIVVTDPLASTFASPVAAGMSPELLRSTVVPPPPTL